MLLDNNLHAYATIKKRIMANYDCPYNDGSVMKKGSKFYKDTIKKDQENYAFLSHYIETGEPIEITSIHFPCRNGSRIDDLQNFVLEAYDNTTFTLYSFDVKTEEDSISAKNHDYYVCELNIEGKDCSHLIEIEPVKHGHWDTIKNAYGEVEGFIHVECGRTSKSKDNYCPKCGVKMDEEEG